MTPDNPSTASTGPDWPDDLYEDQYWDEREEYCDHSDADLDWQGYFECPCGHRWDATAEQMEEYWRYYELANAPPTIWMRLKDWWWWQKQNVRRLFATRKERELSDDVPF